MFSLLIAHVIHISIYQKNEMALWVHGFLSLNEEFLAI